MPKAMLWCGCQILEAFLISLAPGSSAHETRRSFDRMKSGREWHISDLWQCAGKHAGSKFTSLT